MLYEYEKLDATYEACVRVWVLVLVRYGFISMAKLKKSRVLERMGFVKNIFFIFFIYELYEIIR